jgi:hypothetical protein
MRLANRSRLFGAPVSEAPTDWPGTNWDALPVYEKAVQWAAYFADREKVRETGTNRGYWVVKFLAYVGLGPGYSWCAAFVSDLLFLAGWSTFKSAAVLGWRDWANRLGRVRVKPSRGMLAYWVKGSGPSQKRHIEIVIATAGEACPTSVHSSGKVPVNYVHTIGGNTGSGIEGSQEDGDGVYRRLRRVGDFTGFIQWW